MDSNVEAHRNLLPFSGFISSTGTDGSLMVTDIFIFPDKLDGKLPCFCRLSHQVAGRFTEGQTRKRHLPQILANIADFDFPTEFVRLVTPVVHKMRAMPECLWCEISQNPTDPTHIRIQHGWTESTEWFTEACETKEWFAEYVRGLAGIADKSRGRNVTHFNRIPIN